MGHLSKKNDFLKLVQDRIFVFEVLDIRQICLVIVDELLNLPLQVAQLPLGVSAEYFGWRNFSQFCDLNFDFLNPNASFLGFVHQPLDQADAWNLARVHVSQIR